MTIRSAGFGPADEFGQTSALSGTVGGFGTSLLYATDEQCASSFPGLRKVQVTMR